MTDSETIVLPDGLRVLVNNAGIESDNLPIEHMPADMWRRMFETNVFGLVEVTRRALPIIARTRRRRDLQHHLLVDVGASALPRDVPASRRPR